MAWTTMHFAAGMGGAGLLAGVGCLALGRGWRWLGPIMTAGGVWGCVPDLPRLFREDFPSLPLAGLLGRSDLEDWLHSIGDLFFLHARLDAQPRELALHGLLLILLFYNLALVQLLWIGRKRPRHAPQAEPTERPPVPARQNRQLFWRD
ncbi:MAG: hypothetical protein ACOCTI_08855 [Phycisphaeraceae bacterium]